MHDLDEIAARGRCRPMTVGGKVQEYGMREEPNGWALKPGRNRDVAVRPCQAKIGAAHEMRRTVVFIGAIAALLGATCLPAFSAVRTLTLHAPDGTSLAGTYFAAKSRAPAVILFHQGNRDRHSWDDVGRRLAASGINALALDMRGFGGSGGKRFGTLSRREVANLRAKLWPEDIETAWRFLVAHAGVRRNAIGLAGAGWDGVDNAVLTASRHSAAVKSLALLSGETFLPGLRFLHKSRDMAVLAVADSRDEYPPTVEAMELLYALAGSHHKYFLHYGGPEAPWLGYEDRPGVAPSGGHGTDMFQVHPELAGQIVTWFRNTLLDVSGAARLDPPASTRVPFDAIVNRLEEPGGIQAVGQQLAVTRKKRPQAQLWPEIVLGLLAGDHFRAGEVGNAIGIMTLNVQAYPDSADIHGDLAAAYLASGKTGLARRHAQRSLEILNTPGAKASSWSNTEAQRAAIRRSAMKTLEATRSRSSNKRGLRHVSGAPHIE